MGYNRHIMLSENSQDRSVSHSSFIHNILKGIAHAFPVVMGYLPVGFAYGVLAIKAGLSMTNTMIMSIFVYAGSSQFVAVGLMAAGSTGLSVVLTTLIVNLRHTIMSAAMSPYLKKWRKTVIAFFGFELTDETFALHSLRTASDGLLDQTEALSINIISHISWVVGSWLGAVAGGLITDVRPLGLDYALVAMFIALLVMQVRNRTQLLVAIFSGALSLFFWYIGMNQWYVIAAAVTGATLGLLVEEKCQKPLS